MSSDSRHAAVRVGIAVLLSFVVVLVSVSGALGDLGGIAAGRDGDIWFTEPAGNEIGRITPNGTVTQLQVPTADSEPADLALGPEGDIWFTESKTNKIGRLDASGSISEFPVPLPPAKHAEEVTIGLPSLPPPANAAQRVGPGAITLGADGNLWFSEGASGSSASSIYGGEIDRITPTGAISQFVIPSSPNSEPDAITLGPDGDLWFTENTLNGSVIGRVTPAGTITTFPLPEHHEASAIAPGPDGDLWFTDRASDSKSIIGMIGRITPSGTIRDYPIPSREAQPDAITLGPDGDLWFTAAPPNAIIQGPHGLSAGTTTGIIGRMTPAGQVTEFTTRHEAFQITSSPDGDLWFTEGCLLSNCTSGNEIGRITPAGKITEYPTKPSTKCPAPKAQSKHAHNPQARRRQCGRRK